LNSWAAGAPASKMLAPHGQRVEVQPISFGSPPGSNGQTVRAQPESSTAESGRRERKVFVPVRTLLEARFTGNNHFCLSAHSHRLIRRKIRIEGSPAPSLSLSAAVSLRDNRSA